MRLSAFEVWMATRIAFNIEGEYPPDISEIRGKIVSISNANVLIYTKYLVY